MGWFGPTKAEKAAAEKAAAEKGSDRHLWYAANNNNKPELKRLIGLGWNVNWHNPSVRRRMRLAWAPASFRLCMLRPQPCELPRRRWLSRCPAGTPGFAYAPSTGLLGAPTPRELLLKSASLTRCVAPVGRMDSAHRVLEVRIRRLCRDPP